MMDLPPTKRAFADYFTAIVIPACVDTPPIVTTTGVELPVVDPAGTTTFICSTPSMPPPIGPAY